MVRDVDPVIVVLQQRNTELATYHIGSAAVFKRHRHLRKGQPTIDERVVSSLLAFLFRIPYRGAIGAVYGLVNLKYIVRGYLQSTCSCKFHKNQDNVGSSGLGPHDRCISNCDALMSFLGRTYPLDV